MTTQPNHKNNLPQTVATASSGLAAAGNGAGLSLFSALDKDALQAEFDGLLVNAESLLTTTPPPSDPVVEGFFDTGDKVALFAKSKQRKSFATLQLAMAIAAGRDDLGFVIPKERVVLTCQLEIKPDHNHRRVIRMAEAVMLDARAFSDRLTIMNGRGKSITMDKIIEAAKLTQAEVVIIDPVYKLGVGDESIEFWADVLAGFDRLVEETGAALLFVHHDKKGTSGDQQLVDRGSGSGIVGRDYDAAIFLTPSADGDSTVMETITRNYPPRDPVVIRWTDGCFEVDSNAVAQVETSASARNRRAKGPTTEKLVEQAVELMKPGEKILKAEFRSRLDGLGVAINKAKEITTLICERDDFEATTTKDFPAKYYIQRLTGRTGRTGGTNE